MGPIAEWEKAKSLHELMKLPEELKPYIEDYKIRVYDIAFLSDNVINKFTSDFKIIARFFKDRRIEMDSLKKRDLGKVRHAEAVLDLMSVFTNDNRYRKLYTEAIKEQEKSKEEIDMCWMLQGWIDEGMEKGMEKGIEKSLAAMVNTLKPLIPDFKELYRAVTANEIYAHVTEEQIRAYYEG